MLPDRCSGLVLFLRHMDCTSTHLSYGHTGFFSKIVIDYLGRDPNVLPFIEHPANIAGIEASINGRKRFKTDRQGLVNILKEQYALLPAHEKVMANIDSLLGENSFTITTAHQPCIFTGTLFFIYKIIHTIKLAERLQKELPGSKFIPVYYMGSEDADLDELGKIWLNGEEIAWDTRQTGAVGRMKTKGLEKIINRLEGELGVLPFGEQLIKTLKQCYLESNDIKTATQKLVHSLFAEYGLVIFIPDSASVKSTMTGIYEDDLFQNAPSAIVEETIAEFSKEYKIQANPRAINLFYLTDEVRERIERVDDEWHVIGTSLKFSEEELRDELHKHPERFSPNVILRGLLQETILPNVAFIGGGGELAYWLELKKLFTHYQVPFPVLILRNSFLIIEKKWKQRLDRIGISETEIFSSSEQLLNELVKRESQKQVTLLEEVNIATQYYEDLARVAANIDKTLVPHVNSLQTRATKALLALEKKLLRAEKKKFDEDNRHILQLKEALFPGGNLQERIENFMPYYAKWGSDFIKTLYENSLTLEQEFVILTEKAPVEASVKTATAL